LTQKLEHFYAVIMAGGGGTRLWPLSRLKRPKQMLRVIGNRTLFQMTIDRLQGLFSLDHVLIVTSESQAREFMLQVPRLKKKNFLLEPEPKGTAAVICLAANILYQHDENSIMAVLTADHIIKNPEAFRQCLIGAYKAALQDNLVTLGIKPTTAHTGYGYIQQGERLGVFDKINAFEVKQFKEKPKLRLAQKYLASGDHLWNSGMFIWKTTKILDSFQKIMPDHYQKIRTIAANWRLFKRSESNQLLWKSLQQETIDFGIMEHAKNVVVMEAFDLGWSDLGSWESFFEIIDPNQEGNSISSKFVFTKKTKNSLIFQSDSKKLIVTLGLDDMIIVETRDAILICRKENVQEIRDLVREMSKSQIYNRFL
jgi:mannose-1-phosphate guanylyltransferase